MKTETRRQFLEGLGVCLVGASLFGLGGVLEHNNREEAKRQQADFSANYDLVDEVNRISGLTITSSRESEQELLNALGVDYKLKPTERLDKLWMGGADKEHFGAYIGISEKNAEFGTMRGYVKPDVLQKYVDSHKTNKK
jgi:hypothetical protein